MIATDKVITVYHKGYDNSTDSDTYTRTRIAGVSIYDHATVAASTNGLVANDSVTIRVPETAETGGKAFCLPKAYQNAEDKTGLWTVSPGDVIVLQDTDREVDDEHPWASIESDFDLVCTVTGCRDRRQRLIPHIIIEGK